MSTKVEKMDNNIVKITMEIDAVKFEEGMKHSYNKNKAYINIQGFRKGKAPRKLIEIQYGKEVFYEDAVNFVLPSVYESVVTENNLDVVSRPSISVEEVNENGAIIIAEVTVKPEVKVSNYKGIQYLKQNIAVTEVEISDEIKKVQEKNSRLVTVTDRAIQNDDIVTIDFKGFMDGVPFDGGEGKDYELTIGTHTFIDTFEEQLVGHHVGDDMEVNVNFPENYGKEELSGKPALFQVEIKDIKVKELPELNDDFAQDVSEFDTLDEYKNSIKERLLEQKSHKAEHDTEDLVLKTAIERTEMNVPNVMIENQMEQLLEDFYNRLKMQGLSPELFIKYSGQSIDELKESFREPATNNVKGRLVLEAIAKQENFDVADEEINEEIVKIGKNYGIDAEKMKELTKPEDRKSISGDLQVQKALKFLVENGIAVDKMEEVIVS